MALEISGKVHKVLETIGGTSKNGNEWQKGQFVMEYGDNFPKQVYCTAWGDMITQVEALKSGDEIKASIDLQSREYNGRWYTDAKVWRIVPLGEDGGNGGKPIGKETPTPTPPPPPEAPDSSDDNNTEDDLPF